MAQRQPSTQRDHSSNVALRPERCQNRDHATLAEPADDDSVLLDPAFLDFLLDQRFDGRHGLHHSGFVIVDGVGKLVQRFDVEPSAESVTPLAR